MRNKKTLLDYPVASENLDAILAGLEVNQQDRVLCVGASGDQAFAILEEAGSVLVAETLGSQLDYIRRRRELLKNGAYNKFLNAAREYGKEMVKVEANLPAILYYFSKEGRLEKIRRNLKNLKLPRHSLDIFTAMQQKEYTKVYLSNLLTWGGKKAEKILFYLRQMAESIPSGCLVYVSDHLPVVYMIAPLMAREREIKEGEESLIKQRSLLETTSGILPENLGLDIRLTNIARQLETGEWSPAVYRKI